MMAQIITFDPLTLAWLCDIGKAVAAAGLIALVLLGGHHGR